MVDFADRLLRFLSREEHDERRQLHDLRALPVDERVLVGECIAGARLWPERCTAERTVLQVDENMSKFRHGDAVTLSDGHQLAFGSHWTYVRYDDVTHALELERDRFGDAPPALDPRATYCIDRRLIGARGRLRELVHAGFAQPRVRALLDGTLAPASNLARADRGRVALGARGLNAAQVEHGALALASEGLSLVQGPPGTGKTRLLGEILALLCGKGTRVALCAFTHRAVDHALLTVRKLAPSLPIFKLTDRAEPDLPGLGVQVVGSKRAQLIPKKGALVGGTAFALGKLVGDERFHLTVFDEAGQLPIPHALAGLLLADRWMFFGDHKQLPPVISAQHADAEAAASIFAHLCQRYACPMLDVTYRMNDHVCEVVSGLFYGGGLRPAPAVGARRMPFVPGGRFDDVLAPEKAVVFARIDHLQPGMRAQGEANLVADLVAEMVRRHGVPPGEVAVIAPFRAQVRVIRSALQRKALPGSEAIMIDTVERIQGQEREVIVLSLAVGDPDALERRGTFFLSTHRMNVALSRARVKAIVVGSQSALLALPGDVEGLRAAAAFRRLAAMVPQVDFTAVYGGLAADG
jgi:DNA replication ATP-dependent helicase Dna2